MHSIYTEGKDKLFIQEYLTWLFADTWKIKIEVKQLNGWTNLPKITNELSKTTSLGFRNFVIFDADTLFNNGGFIRRKQELEILKCEDLQFELFLFPNNQLDGDFELLLEQIINPQHKGLLDCFSKYENCISQYKDSDSKQLYVTPARKAKIYSYVDAFPKSNSQEEKFKKGDFFFLNSEYWDLSNIFLEPLKLFLTEIVK